MVIGSRSGSSMALPPKNSDILARPVWSPGAISSHLPTSITAMSSKLRYFLATRCTSAAVTFWMASR